MVTLSFIGILGLYSTRLLFRAERPANLNLLKETCVFMQDGKLLNFYVHFYSKKLQNKGSVDES